MNGLRFPVISRVEELEDRSLLSAVGVSIDAASHQLMIFDPVTGTQTGQVAIPSSDGNSDTVISPDGTTAYVSTFFNGQVFVVDLTNKTLAGGINPISVPTQAEDLAITSDGKYLLVVDGSNVNPIVVIDTTTRAAVSVLHENIGHSGVDVTAAGDVLIASVNNSVTRRYHLDAAGQLTFTGQSIANGGMNVTAAPGGITAVEANGNTITSFVIGSMSSVSSLSLNAPVQGVAMSPDGTHLYVRTLTEVIGYNFNETTGSLGTQLFYVGGLSNASMFFGTDQLDVTPDGSRIYTSAGSQVLLLDALSGAILGDISQPNAYFVGVDIVSAVTGPGAIAGIKFNDLDADGERDGNEPGLPGWIIYADLDNDSTRDAGEPFATTDADGAYTLPIDSGAYTLREELQSGWVQTSPGLGLYATGNGGSSLITLNPNTGTGTVVGSFGANVRTTYAGTFTPDGTFWTIMNSFDSSIARLATVNLTTGLVTPVGTANWNGAPVVALEADAAGNLYAGNFNGVFASVNKTTGQLTQIGNLGFGNITDLTFATDGSLWGVAANRLYRINPATGTSTPGPVITGTDGATQGIMVDPVTGVCYASTFSNSSRLYTLDLSTGIATVVGTGIGINSTNGGDFMPLSVNRGRSVTVIPGQTAANCNFGNILNQGTVTGTKFNDLDGDGTRDGNEPGLPGWTIYADLDNDSTRDAGEPFAVTDSNGDYALTIATGSYTLREESQAGWVQTVPQSGLYSTGSNGTSLISINPATGVGTIVGPFGANTPTTYAGAFTPDGTFWTIINSFDPSLSRLARVNLATGAVTSVGATNWSGSPIIALEADAAGNLYGASFGGVLFSINKSTGQLTSVGNLGFTNIRDLTFDNNGTLWGVAGNRLYQINPLSGASIPGPAITGTNAETQGIMVDPVSGVFYGLTYTSTSKFYTIDVTTGAATLVGSALGVSAANGGDFMPLSVNRGLSVTINVGQTATGRNFGNIVDQGTVTGTKFNDLDGDGTRDGNEPGLPGWTIYADLDNDGTHDAAEPATTTDANGAYTLVLASGAYTIREEAQSGWVQTSPVPGLFATGNNAFSVISINPATGVGAVVGPSGLFVNEFGSDTIVGGAVTPDGTFWTILNSFDPATARLAKANLATGAVTAVGTPNWSGAPLVALEADASGNLYGGDLNGGFYAINKTTGQLTLLGNLGFTGVKDFSFDNAGTLWAVSNSNLYRLNLLTGGSTAGPTITGANAEVLGIMVDPLTGVFYASTYTSNSRLYTVDLTSGVATPVGTGIVVSAPIGGDFVPLAANRGLAVTIAINRTSSNRDFGNQRLNLPPVITSAASVSIPENTTAVMQVTATDPDVPAQAITFAIAGGTDANKFAINATTGELSFITAPSFESPTHAVGATYSVIVRATDSGSPPRSVTQTIAVNVTDVNESPVIVSNNAASLAENTTAVLTVQAVDQDSPPQQFTFAIAGGADANRFTIDPSSGVLSFNTAPDFEDPADTGGDNVYNVNVQVTDSGTPSQTTTQAIAVNVNDVESAIVSVLKVADGAEQTPTPGKLRVTQSQARSSDTVIHYSIAGSANAGSDYSALKGSITIAAGQTSADIDVEVLDDAIVEGTETLVITLTSLGSHAPETELNPNSGNLTATVDIADDDSNALTISSPTIAEGDTGTKTLTFTVTSASAVQGGFTIDFTVTGATATSTDYALLTGSPLTFAGAAGETQNITVTVVGDIVSELAETVSITLGAVTAASPAIASSIVTGATGTGTIVDDDAVTFAINDVIASEGSGVVQFNLVADKPFDTDVTLTVTFSTVVGTGVGVGYDGTSQEVTLPAGQTSKTVSVPLNDDNIVEGNEVVRAALSASSSLAGRTVDLSDTATATITDDDSAIVTIAKITDGAESNSPVNGKFRVTQSAVSATDTVVNYTVAGTATSGAGGDYLALTGTITIPAGQTTADIDVNVLNDAFVEGTETVSVTLAGFGAHDPQITLSGVPANLTGTVNITDNDTPTITSAATVSVPENTLTSTVVLDVDVNDALIPGHSVAYSLSGADAARFNINATTGQITFRVVPNYEAPVDQGTDNAYQVTVTATADVTPSRSTSQSLTINVTPVNDLAPVFVNASPTFAIPENSAVGTTVGSVSATDGDLAPQTLTYSILSGNSSGAFAINSATGQITVANSTPLNFETTPQFTLTVQVTDNGAPTALTANAVVVVNLINVSEGPKIVIPTSTGTYPLGSGSVLITPDATFSYGDVAKPNFNGAKLTVSISVGRANSDVLDIASQGTGPNQISIKKEKIYFGSTQIGTFTGGSGGSPNLVVTLNSSATAASVQQLIRSLTLKTNGKVGTKRTVSLQLTNIAGANSNVATREFTVAM